LSLATAGSVLATYEDAAQGQTAAYMVRWISTTGEPGPWSSPTPATVAA
jgi:hypothetical protein